MTELSGGQNMLDHVSLADDEGASAVEYGLLVAAIAAIIVIIVFSLGGVVQGLFSKTCSGISSQASVAGQCG
jgi:pilus assembly protein Flp/PilA